MNNLILLAEDEEDDVYFMRRAFKEAGLSNRLEVATNGTAVVRYLKGDGEFSDRQKFPLPQFIFLDLKMPIMDGFEVLSWIKSQPHLTMPVAVLSSSAEEKDIKRTRELGGACYLIKPPTPEMLRACWAQFELS